MKRTLMLAVIVALSATACAKRPEPSAGTQPAALPRLTALELAAFDLPIYPNAVPDESVARSIARVVKRRVARVAALRTRDAVEKVARWYEKHLPPDYEATRVTYGEDTLMTFALESDGAHRAVLVKPATADDGRTFTAITLMAHGASSKR